MIDHNKLDEYIGTLEEILLFMRDYRNIKREDALTGDYLLEFHHLKESLRSRAWPAAIPTEAICRKDSVEDKESRAQGILADLIKLDGLSFLDYGCGEGHVVLEAAKTARRAVGFDITQTWQLDTSAGWKLEDGMLTTDPAVVSKLGPYDIILLYDVLDHCDNPVEVLTTVKSLRKGNGPVYIRCHPWTSRHATHLYHDINKAFLHLVFSDKELLKLGFKGVKTAKITKPDETYKQWFKTAGFQVKSEKSIRVPVEEFFAQDTVINKRLRQHWAPPFPLNDLSLEFLDYILA